MGLNEAVTFKPLHILEWWSCYRSTFVKFRVTETECLIGQAETNQWCRTWKDCIFMNSPSATSDEIGRRTNVELWLSSFNLRWAELRVTRLAPLATNTIASYIVGYYPHKLCPLTRRSPKLIVNRFTYHVIR